MKILRVEPFAINDTSLRKVDLPTSEELTLASFTHIGKPLLQYWFEFGSKLQNSDGTKIRNRSSADVYAALDIDGFPTIRDFKAVNGNEYLTSRFRGYSDLPWDSDQFTIFAVVKGNLTSGNTFVLGQHIVDETIVNPPNINISSSGLVNIYKNGVTNLIASLSVPEVLTKLKLITVSHSAKNGCSIRVDKLLGVNGVTANAKMAGNCKKLRLMGGSSSISANFNGDIAALILCPIDLTNTIELTEIENYLFNKYCS